MIELNNITFLQYFELEDKSEYDYAIKYAYRFNEPVNHIQIPEFFQMPFGFVKDLQYDFSQGITWDQIFGYLNKIKTDGYQNWKLLELCQMKTFLANQIDFINTIESEKLTSDNISADEVEAGIDELSELGIYLQIRELTGGDVTKNEAVRNTKYEDCFVELVTQKRLADYQRELRRIQARNLSH